MKIRFLTMSLGVLLSCGGLFAQVVSKDSIQALEQQKDAIELSKDVNDKKTQLAKLQNDLEKKNKEAQESAAKAERSARENQTAAARLSSNAQDKKLADQAKNSARRAERDAKAARKAADNQKSTQEDIAKLQSEISEQESKIIAVPAATFSGNAVNTAAGAPTAVTSAPSPQPSTTSTVNPVTYRVDTTASSNAAVKNITDRVIESTYRNYPQQQGQPSIIINNIIIPSDYERPAAKPADRDRLPQRNAMQADERRNDPEYEEFLRWKNERRNSQQSAYRANTIAQEDRQQEITSHKMGFKDRFGEMPKRKSGLWVIPLVGIHASGFDADFTSSEAEGRTGWNAGLDFRFHAKRFFIQPGVHYFNSSLRLTDKDSLSSAPLLDGPRIHSLKVPLMLGVYLTKANSGFFKFNIKGGATGNYIIAVDKDSRSTFQKDDVEEYSYGLAAGVGLEFGLITLDLSHEWGMSSYLKNTDVKNNVLRATLGLKL
ncbi:outer membrane beta-barrel protein [Dyadobacter psychrotolerans]|nr:outer membrane beta-barrel protein [Dyadobacter psychrotolerans]